MIYFSIYNNNKALGYRKLLSIFYYTILNIKRCYACINLIFSYEMTTYSKNKLIDKHVHLSIFKN